MLMWAPAFASIARHRRREAASEVRIVMLSALNALAEDGGKWSDRLRSILKTASSDREKFYAAAYLARLLGPSTPKGIAHPLAELFADLPEGEYPVEVTNLEEPEDLFWESVRAMERSSGVACLAAALERCSEAHRLVRIMEWLLRLASSDQRSGWGNTASSRGPKIDYFGIQAASQPGGWLRSPEATAALSAIANKNEVWRIQTNLLGLFGLPGSRKELRELLRRRERN